MAERVKRFFCSVLAMACTWLVVMGVFFAGNWLATTLIVNSTWVGIAGGAFLLLILVGLIDAWKV